MALKTDDCDIRDVRFYMDHGGNGDYYINLLEYDEHGKYLKGINYRMAMSGGFTSSHTEVRLAFAALYRAMEAAGLNNHPHSDGK
jgi:hypothetical protein